MKKYYIFLTNHITSEYYKIIPMTYNGCTFEFINKNTKILCPALDGKPDIKYIVYDGPNEYNKKYSNESMYYIAGYANWTGSFHKLFETQEEATAYALNRLLQIYYKHTDTVVWNGSVVKETYIGKINFVKRKLYRLSKTHPEYIL